MTKIKAIFFLCLFLISQASFSIELHYCHQELTDISLAGKANCVCLDNQHSDHNKECHEHKNECQHSNNEQVIEKPCCSTKSISIDNTAEFISIKKNVEISKVFIPASTIFAFVQPSVSVLEVLPEVYIPPLIYRDVRVEIQSFQI